ncbi:MAG: helix-turn-helix domain-containing protein, partial [Phenylobacterium sp.]|nr:helix-turn-helix domain-containing protein [Phenylobacterium sp.]
MKLGPDIARIGALLGDPARANMLTALVGGQALPAGELAREAGITASTASSHLGKLTDDGLLVRV